MGLLATRGLAGTTIRRIASRAGMSEGGLYRHFSSRAEIMNAVLDFVYEQRYSTYPKDPSLTGLEILRHVGREHLRMVESSAAWMIPWLELVSRGAHEGLREAMLEHQNEANSRLRKVIEKGKADGSIRADIDTEGLALKFVSWTWGPVVASAIGLTEFYAQGHSRELLEALLQSAANTPPK